MTWIFYLIYLYIFGAEGSVFLSFPSTNWKNSSKVCTLPSRQNIENIENASKLLVDHGVEQAWTSTRVAYSRWAAFAGCLDDVTQATQRIHVSLDDCAVECSRVLNNKFFAYKNEECFCFGEVKNINTYAHICRQLCTNNTSDVACHTGNSALLFRFIEVTDARMSQEYIEKECISTTPQNGTRFVENCDTTLKIHCKDNTVHVRSENWYAYQKECFKGTVISLTIKNSDKISTEFRYWTPIFRRNILQLDQSEAGGYNKALALKKNGRIEVANCTDQLPFLCSSNHTSRIQREPIPENKLLRSIKLPIWAVIATGTVFVILILIIFVTACKIRKMKTMIAERDSRLPGGRPDNFPPPSRSQSNKVRLRDTYMDAADSPLRRGGYNDVYDDVNKGFKIKS